MKRLLVLALLMGMADGVRADATVGTSDGRVQPVDLDGDGVPDSIRLSGHTLWINDVIVLSNIPDSEEYRRASFEVTDLDPTDGRQEVIVVAPGLEDDGLVWVIGYRDHQAKVLLHVLAEPIAERYVRRKGVLTIEEYVWPNKHEHGCRRIRSGYRLMGGEMKRVRHTISKPTECAG